MSDARFARAVRARARRGCSSSLRPTRPRCARRARRATTGASGSRRRRARCPMPRRSSTASSPICGHDPRAEQLADRAFRARDLALRRGGERAHRRGSAGCGSSRRGRRAAAAHADRCPCRARRARSMRSSTLLRPPPPPPEPIATRSFISVVIATVQPSLTSPSTFSCGTRTSSKKTSLNAAPPFICLSGLIVTPGACMSTMNAVMPLCFSASGSVRQMISPKSEYCAPEVHTFWPLSTHSSPSRTAVVDERRDVGAGARLAEQLAPDLLAAQQLGEVALLLRVGAARLKRRRDHAEPDDERRGRHAVPRFLLAEDDLLHRRAVAATELGFPRDPREPGVELRAPATLARVRGSRPPPTSTVARRGADRDFGAFPRARRGTPRATRLLPASR